MYAKKSWHNFYFGKYIAQVLGQLNIMTLNATAIKTHQVLRPHLTSVQSLNSEQELLFRLRA